MFNGVAWLGWCLRCVCLFSFVVLGMVCDFVMLFNVLSWCAFDALFYFGFWGGVLLLIWCVVLACDGWV